MLLGQAFNNISYTRRFNALKQITGDPRKTKQLLKEKNEIFVKETQFLFGEKFESDIIRTAKSKQKSKEVFSAMTNKQPPFRRGPLLEHQQNKGRGQNVKMVLSKNHSRHTWKPGKQQHQNEYWPQFQGYQGKTLSFKSGTTKQNFLDLSSVLQCKQSPSTCKGPVSKKSNSRSTSSRETKIFLFKFGQTYARYEYRKHSSKIRDSLSQKPCAGKVTQPSTRCT